MIYALGIFHIRLSNILSEQANKQFHDRWGPTVLCVFLIGGYFLNFYSKFGLCSAMLCVVNGIGLGRPSTHLLPFFLSLYS